MTNEEILKEILDTYYPELHSIRNALDPLGPEPHSEYGSFRHTLCNLRNLLMYFEENQKND